MVSGYDIKFTSGGHRRRRLIIPNPVNMAAPVNVRNARERSLGEDVFNLPVNIFYCQIQPNLAIPTCSDGVELMASILTHRIVLDN